MSEYKPLTCLPVLPLRGIVVFPGCVTHFDVGRSKSARAVEEAMRADQMIFLIAQRDVQCDEPKKADLYQIGTVAYVRQILRLPGDNMRILVEGKYRAQLTDMIHSEPYFFARAMELDVPGYNASVPRTQALVRQAHQLFEQFIDLAVKSGQENLLQGSSTDDAGELADFIAQNATFGYEDKQKILETLPPVHRLELCVRTMEAIDAGTATYTPQDNSQATHTAKIYKEMGSIDWKQGAKEIECLIRGLDPWPSAYTRLGDKMLKIWKAQVVSEESGAEPGCIVKVEKDHILVQTGKGMLAISELQLEGKKRMPVEAFLNGYEIEEGTYFKKG